MEKLVPVEKVYNLMTTVFEKVGVPKNEAKIVADVLIASDLRGIRSHGVGRLKMYYDRIKDGVQTATTKIDVIKDFAATAVWDGNHGMGHVIAHKAMETAIEKAKKYGMGSVAVRNSTHFGIDGYYARMAAKENMIGMSFTNARPSIPPTFGVTPMLGTNPIAFAAPTDMDFCFLFDAATSIIQRGKVEVYNRMGKKLPEGWVIDNNGEPLTDAGYILKALVDKKAALLPLGGVGEQTGGHKGYGLATIVEILSASLQTGAYMYGLTGIGENGEKVPFRVGHFFMAINVEAFVDVEQFKKTTGDILRDLKNSQKIPGHDKIYVAGEKEFENEKKIKETGIPFNDALQKNVKYVMKDLGITDIDLGF